MKKSFSSEAETEEVTGVSTEMFDEGDNLPAQQTAVTMQLGTVSGPVSQRDIQMPRMHLVQAVGALSENFDPGSVVLNREHAVYGVGDTPLDITILTVRKYYEERKAYDPTAPMPKIYNNLDEVLADGKWADWRNDEAPPVRDVADLLVLIDKPEGIESPCFTWEVDGKPVTIAMWTVRGTAYTRAAKKVISACAIELKTSGVMAGKWTLGTFREKIGSNFVFVPQLKLALERNSAERIEAIKAQFA